MNNSATLSVQTGLAPTVELISPGTNQWFNYGNLTLLYNTTDANNNFASSKLIINNALNQTNLTDIINYAYNAFTINFSSGQYNWTVNVTDTSGYESTISQRTFYIDLINPNISLIYPEDSSSFELNQLNLSFNVTDNLDTNLTCRVVLDGNIIQSGRGAVNGDITNISSGILSGGIHYWNVTCTDNAIRNFTSSTFNFNISDTPSNITLIYPSPDYKDNDGIISFIYNASDNTGFINCSLIINETYRIWNQSAISNYQNNAFNIEGLSEGYYNWTVECFDLSSTSSKPFLRNFSQDLYKPRIDLNLPLNSATSLVSNVSFNFTVNDTFDSSLNCNLTINGVVRDTFNTNAGNLTNRQINLLTDGLKYWNVTCIDDTLNINTSSTRTLNITEKPSVSLNTPNNSRFNQTSINLAYTPYDNTNLSSCNLYINGIFNQSNSSPILNNQQNIFSLNSITEGIYNWSVGCSDYIGLTNQSETRLFYADRSPPLINISYPNGEEIYAPNITFNFTVIDYLDINISCNLTVNSSFVDINFSANNGSITSRTVSGIMDGYNLWSLSCWDIAGNINTSSTFNFTRYTNPRSTLISPENNTWFNTSQATLIYLPEDDGGIISASLFINRLFNMTNSTPIANLAYNNFSMSGLADGSYYWNVNVTDSTQLTGIGETRRFYIDTQSPSLISNMPSEYSVIDSNNVTFNFTVYDNLDSDLNCIFILDGEEESSGTYSNSSYVIQYATLGDGSHNWRVNCIDNSLNLIYSDLINFTVKAPPLVTLVSPGDNFRTTNSSINFSYIPYDLIEITNCSIYLNGIFNQSDISVLKNQVNNFTINGIPEGINNWTVNCSDSDGNLNWSAEKFFYRDISSPSIVLESPRNNTGVDFNEAEVYFTWTSIDILDNVLQCNVSVDGIVRLTNVWVSSNVSKSDYVLSSVLGQGQHFWTVTCWDQLKNANTSELRKFNLTYPDFSVNTEDIVFNQSNPKENESVQINATIHNLAGVDINNVVVKFYKGNPDSGGTQIGSDSIINLLMFNETNATINWKVQMGTSQIYVLVDPPLATNGSFKELNESNNKADKNITIGSWQFLYGDISSSSKFRLSDSEEEKLISWDINDFDFANVYSADYDAVISWSDLKAIGKTSAGGESSSDFSEIDSLLNMTSFSDSVYNVYTSSGIVNEKQNFFSFKKLISEVPVMNSTNNSNFKTGILWDSSGDIGDGEFDIADKEELVFIASVNKNAPGAYGIYDYELRVPAKLREYNLPDSSAASFYVEIA
jgi:hypothetical protein